MKLATEIRTDDFYTPNQDLQNLISEIDHQEILAIFRYYAAFNEDPQKIITGVFEAYGVNEEMDSERVKAFEQSAVDLYNQLKAAGYIRDSKEFKLAEKLFRIIGKDGLVGYLLAGMRGENHEAGPQNERYEKLHVTGKEYSEVIKVLMTELPPRQYEMVNWILSRPNATIRVSLTLSEQCFLDTALNNVERLLPDIADIIGLIL